MWLDNLRKMKEQSGMTTKEISVNSGIPEPTLEKLFAGATRDPKLATMQQLVHFLGYTLDDLDGHQKCTKKASLYSSEAMRLAQDYDTKLDVWGKRQVRSTADIEIARCTEQEKDEISQSAEETVYFVVPWFFHPMSAGTGEEAGNEQPDDLRLTKAPPRGTSYVAPVSGNSMEPTYHDGDKLFIRSQERIEPGQIGVFFMDGKQWVKELGNDTLISHNQIYDPIPMREDIRCQGLVLGVCDDSYFE